MLLKVREALGKGREGTEAGGRAAGLCGAGSWKDGGGGDIIIIIIMLLLQLRREKRAVNERRWRFGSQFLGRKEAPTRSALTWEEAPLTILGLASE